MLYLIGSNLKSVIVNNFLLTNHGNNILFVYDDKKHNPIFYLGSERNTAAYTIDGTIEEFAVEISNHIQKGGLKQNRLIEYIVVYTNLKKDQLEPVIVVLETAEKLGMCVCAMLTCRE